MRRRSLPGVSFCAVPAGRSSSRMSGEDAASGGCVPAGEAGSSPSMGPSREGGAMIDVLSRGPRG